MKTSYDQIAYPGYPYSQTHPDRLATVAYLHGMNPAPVERCRVLELGCGDGANLIPMALQLPESRFHGLDLAPTAIEKGCRQIRHLGLANIRLEQGDLMKFSPDGAAYDYIIAHGVFSWVPEGARERMLQIVKAGLAPQGVAFISYNALPGWHMPMMVREMMQYHTRLCETPEQRVEGGRSLAQFLAGAQVEPDTYGALLQQEWKRMSERVPATTFHDELGEFNTPLYFHQFISVARAHHLQYVSEAERRAVSLPDADSFDMQLRNFHPQVHELLNQLGEDAIAREQYLDFLKGRRFHQTLLCHEGVSVERHTSPDLMTGMLVAANAQPSSAPPSDRPEAPVQFCRPNDASITTAHPLIKATLLCLVDDWPLRLPFDLLWQKAHERLARLGSSATYKVPEDRSGLAKTLLLAYAAGVVDLHLWSPRLAARPGARPVCSPLARMQTHDLNDVTSLLHNSVRIAGSLEKKMIQLLDGTRDRAAIIHDLEQAILAGEAELPGQPASIRQTLESGLETELERLAKAGLLIE